MKLALPLLLVVLCALAVEATAFVVLLHDVLAHLDAALAQALTLQSK